jgi:hypothetical protein
MDLLSEPEQQQEEPKESTLLAWESLEYIKSETTKYWIIAMVAVFMIVAGFFIYKKDYVGAGFAVVMGVCLYWYKRQKPVMRKYRVTQLGLYVNDKLYQYNTIHSFSLNASSVPQILTVRTSGRLSPHLNILLTGVDALTIKNILDEYVPEIPKEVTIIDYIIKFLKIQ